MVNSSKIKYRIDELDLNQGYISDKLKIDKSTLNLKINGNRSLTIEEMFQLADVLEIDPEEYRDYFFKN